MAVKKTKTLISKFKKKGFIKDGSTRKHNYYYLYVNDKKTSIRTTFSNSSKWKEYDEGSINLKKKDLHLDNKKQLNDFIECPLSIPEYLQFLRDKGIDI